MSDMLKMGYANKQSFQFALVLFCCVGLFNCQILPSEVCLGCAALFRTQGCLSEPSVLCRLLAFKLTFQVGDQPLCNQRPCIGYGQADEYTCTNIFGCPTARRDPNGICPGVQTCCRNS